MQRIIILIFLFHFYFSSAQENSNIGFGASAGYKCPNGEAGFIIEYKYKKKIDLYSGFSSAKFNGLGYTVGVDVYLGKNQWQPCVGFAYNFQSGNSFYAGEFNVNRSDYKVNPSNNFIGIIGVRKIVLFDDKNSDGFMAFIPYISYRYSSPSNKVHSSGYIRKDKELEINNRIGNGIGFGLKMIYFINKNKTN